MASRWQRKPSQLAISSPRPDNDIDNEIDIDNDDDKGNDVSTARSVAITPTPISASASVAMDIEEGEVVEEEQLQSHSGGDDDLANPLLAIPSEGSSFRPKTADTLKGDIETGTTSGMPITKQVGRDVADVTLGLLVAEASQGIAVDELGMSAELSMGDAVMRDAEG